MVPAKSKSKSASHGSGRGFLTLIRFSDRVCHFGGGSTFIGSQSSYFTGDKWTVEPKIVLIEVLS
jgi:hypothetical protein